MTKEVKKFDAEIDKVLHLMIHSLYQNKDIFLRELISNASDACDKLRYEANKQSDLKVPDELKIKVRLNKSDNTLTVADNGIGMDKQDLVQNLGTIASSGTQKFLENLTGDKDKDVELIGQFGVGFYSVFMVADEVWVKTKKAGAKQVWQWHSTGSGEFTVEEVENQDLENGTEITLKLKKEEDNFLDKFRITHIIQTYSDHISIPIELETIGMDNDETKIVNSSSALWSRSKSEITNEEYNEFYKKVALAGDDPWLTLHNKNEGAVEFTNLLYVPSNPTYDMYHPDRKRRIKLYIKRVFINDEGLDLIPHYLRFVRGIVDSQDLPLNISRETLQHNHVIAKIKDAITKKLINELEKRLKEDKADYIKFWQNFGPVLKEGLCEGFNVPDNLIDICLFKSVKTGELVTLKEYIDNMPEGQKNIFYISGDNPEKLKNHPQLEGFLDKGYDVLLFTDTVDDFWVNVVAKYKEFDIKSITRSDINLETEKADGSQAEEEKEEGKSQESQNDGLIKYFKEVLGDKVNDVKISKKLTKTPVCLSVKEGGMDIRMERYLIEQKQLKHASAKNLELNLKHPIIQKVKSKVDENGIDEDAKNIVWSLFDQACIIEGEPVVDPKGFAERFNRFISGAN